MSREVVRAAAGKPDSVETSSDDDGGNAVETWFYQGGEIELEFEAVADSKLESITAWSAETTVNGIAIIGCDLADLQAPGQGTPTSTTWSSPTTSPTPASASRASSTGSCSGPPRARSST